MKSYSDLGVDRVPVTSYELALKKSLETVPTDMEQTYRGRVSLSLLGQANAAS